MKRIAITSLRSFFSLLSGNCIQSSAHQNAKYCGLTFFPGKAISTLSGEMT
jgi:hypothetical protein